MMDVDSVQSLAILGLVISCLANAYSIWRRL